MTREEVFTKLTEVFRDVFDNDNIVLKEDTVSSDIQDWDSLEFINIVVAVMETFKIKFSIEDLKKLDNVGQLVTLILERVKS
ncbi:MAG: acyl carrier protein [Succinatimonas sp.]|uniref:acyl carrier protein n=1 Tax=Succinivibrio sp. TaxID=2053619 RepID=UPI002A250B94|nr:acyl carrier protein [Succinatimonas sp.]